MFCHSVSKKLILDNFRKFFTMEQFWISILLIYSVILPDIFMQNYADFSNRDLIIESEASGKHLILISY